MMIFKVTKQLLGQAVLEGVDLDAFMEFLFAQTKAIMACPPNVSSRGPIEVRVLRGYYPDTHLFFKISAVTPYESSTTYIKITSGFNMRGQEPSIVLREKVVNSWMTQRMESIVLGAPSATTSFNRLVHAPRCVTPKGMNPLPRARGKRHP